MAVDDLIRKLASCGAVERNDSSHETYFTPKFKEHIITYAGSNRDSITIIQGWRAMLAGFHISLAVLSDEELAVLIQLLEFQSGGQQSATPSS